MNDATARLIEASIDDDPQEAARPSDSFTGDEHYYNCDPVTCVEAAYQILEKEVNSAA